MTQEATQLMTKEVAPIIKEVELSQLGPFVIPADDKESLDEREKILADLRERYTNRFGERGKKDERALVVGRFQPLHPGHTLLIEAAAEVAEKIVVVIGSANIIDERNPFSPEDRQYMLEHMLREKGLLERVEIIRQDDVFNNFRWGEETLRKAQVGGEINVVMSNPESDWINGIFRSRGKKVYEVNTLQRAAYNSTNIRKRLREGEQPVLNPAGLHKIIRPKAG